MLQSFISNRATAIITRIRMLMFYCFSTAALIVWSWPLNESADFVGVWHSSHSVNSLFYQFYVQILYFNTFTTFLYVFRALLCSSSRDQIVLVRHLVSSLSSGDSSVHRLRKGWVVSKPVYWTGTWREWRYQMLY